MTDYLNPHHVYIDTQAAPDLSMNVKRDEAQNMRQLPANIVPETVDTPHNPGRIDAKEIEMNSKDYLDIGKQITDGIREGLGIVSPGLAMLGGERADADKGVEIMENRINPLYVNDTETPAERIIRLYRSGMSHVDIAGRGFDLADVRKVISEATRVDETLYQVHKEGRV